MTFMSSVIDQLIGNEDLMMGILRATNNSAYIEIGKQLIDLSHAQEAVVDAVADEPVPSKPSSSLKP